MSKGVQVAGGATLIALLLGWYATTQLSSSMTFTYYQNLSEFQAALASDGGRASAPARVHGYVANGSIDRDLARMRVSFAVQNEPPHAGGPPGSTLPVLYASLETPDMFKDGAEVVVEGQIVQSDGAAVFHADKLMAKCPSKFEAEQTDTAAL